MGQRSHTTGAGLALVAALAAATVTTSGCVTSTAIWKRDTGVTLPLLIGAVAADLLVTSVVASQFEDFTTAAAIGTAFAITAADVGIGCLVGACTALRL